MVGASQGERGGKSRRGRPRRSQEEARSQRVVTFVTKAELEDLEQIAQREDRSLSAVVHRMIAGHLRNRASEDEESHG